MTRSLVVALVLAGCAPDATAPPAVDETPWLEGWEYRRAIDVDLPPGAQIDVPIAIRLAPGTELAPPARGTVEMTAGDGQTSIAYQRASSFDGIEIWVRAPRVDGPLRVYVYSSDTIIAEPFPAATWNGYTGVWHLSDPMPPGNEYEDFDATRRFGWLVAAPGAPAMVTGVASGARDFDGIDDGLAIFEPTNNGPDFATQSFTYSLWVNEREALDVTDTPLYKGGIGFTQPGYCMLLGSGAWVAQLHDGTRAVSASLGSEVRAAWRHLVAVVDRDAKQLRTYVDGTLQDTVDLTGFGSVATPQPFQIGRSPSQPFRGWIDEVRIYPGALSESRIALEYANLSGSELASIGPEQRNPHAATR